MSKATSYTIKSGDKELGSKSKKANAVEVARAHRAETGEAVQVITDAGTVVFEQSAKKTIKMSPRFSRVVDLPEGVTVPDGLRVAYVRPRAGVAVLHDATEGNESPYSLLNLKTGKVMKGRFATTRDAGNRMTELAAEAKAAQAEPANA